MMLSFARNNGSMKESIGKLKKLSVIVFSQRY